MFPPLMSTWGVVVRFMQFKMPKKEKWARMLLDMVNLIAEKMSQGWDVAFADRSREIQGGGGGLNMLDLQSGLGREIQGMNTPLCQSMNVSQSPELRPVLRVLQKKVPGKVLAFGNEFGTGVCGTQR